MVKNTILVKTWEKADVGRWYFKRALEKHVPEVLQGLHSDVFPTYTVISPEIAIQSNGWTKFGIPCMSA